jgi:protein-tyrosine-phosphatase/DNA-binding HxlR family transcriptional regulator
MNIEQSSPLELRTRVHAALADPARLQIVDLLGVGDASPSELSSVLAMPSNLLAHHLKVLDRAGLVSRRRSDADARKTYLRLRPETLDLLAPAATLSGRVVFVCTANSARSQLADALWRSTTSLPSASAGTHPAKRIAPGARRAARRHRLSLTDGTPAELSGVLRAGDLVVSVCDSAHEELGGLDRIHWSVPDPVATDTTAAYDSVVDELTGRVQNLAARLN